MWEHVGLSVPNDPTINIITPEGDVAPGNSSTLNLIKVRIK
jgi:hypothetical protein